MRHLIFHCFILIVASSPCHAQAISFSDPAQMYNRLVLEKNNGLYQQISIYKVIGSQYLYGEKLSGGVFARTSNAPEVRVSYNAYKQQVDLYYNDAPAAATLEPEMVDSFYINAMPDLSVKERIWFVNGRFAFSDEKIFLQRVFYGSRFSLYKVYKSTLGVVPTNYIDANLRQFDLNMDYVYTDAQTREAKKLKNSYSGVRKQLLSVGDISSIVSNDVWSVNPEAAYALIFTAFNNGVQHP